MKLKAFLIFAILMIAGIGGISQSYANSLVFCSDADKVYVSPEQIIVDHEGIFVVVDGEMVQVQAIMQDDHGVYYLKPSIYWTCRKCGYSKNPAWTNYCQSCKKRYDE